MRKPQTLVLALFSLIFSACEKDPPLNEPGSNEAINQWTLKQMQQYYYWNSKLPNQITLDDKPNIFFKNLLYRDDRYSTILQALNSDTYGNTLSNTFGFDIAQLQHNGQTMQLVTQVVPYSEADLAGLHRGDTIQQVNAQPLAAYNFAPVLEAALKLPSIQLQLQNGKKMKLPASYISQPVVYTAQIFHKQTKVGYLFLSQFDFSGGYSVLEAIRKLKAGQVQDLILDLRYNTGGQVAFASFCSLTFADIAPNYVFVQFKGNKKLGNSEETFQSALAQQPEGYSFQAEELLKSGLQLKRIFVLTGPNTGSASEMLINSLKPYIEVIQIGTKTLGKDMASTTLSSPSQVSGNQRAWLLMPLVYKIYNKDGLGDYSTGLIPHYHTDEFAQLPLLPFGDEKDPLLQQVFNIIQDKTTQSINRKANTSTKTLTSSYYGSSYRAIPMTFPLSPLNIH
ncbi:S41 family peptidase [Sphingobacterium detergens]|uniref:C-terminal processing protease CtpA/Prc n=1 Tax=Sphingobacterium detergens TaxID=1145106 RepID=A0A420B8A6_SPHD1|nr:S41 family peptidase [Sphingobacterium detergens]RKE52947.1 C-terminal processing protease CtpA/Prc [Sphingobacterium detergens]